MAGRFVLAAFAAVILLSSLPGRAAPVTAARGGAGSGTTVRLSKAVRTIPELMYVRIAFVMTDWAR